MDLQMPEKSEASNYFRDQQKRLIQLLPCEPDRASNGTPDCKKTK